MRLIDADAITKTFAIVAKKMAKTDEQQALIGRVFYILEHRHEDVVRCNECVLHDNCIMEDSFNLAGIENPFCCVGFRKEGADND